MTYLLARVENYPRFDGERLTADPVMGYGRRGKPPHEMSNFSVASDGFIYGYLPKDGGGDLERLGGSRGAEEVSNVTVIFISSGILCGYYRNATVFSSPVRHPDGLKAGKSKIYCRVKVNPKDAFLIPIEKRNDELQPRPKGMFPVLYGDEGTTWVDWFENLAAGFEDSLGSEKKRRKWTEKIERSSKARRKAINYYGLKCECCKISHQDNVRSAVFEVHHKVPYAENFETRTLEVTDLAVLCANCHRMLHKMPDVSDVKALRNYIHRS
jgi:5-methylcytosine-specific restriction enzyme A